METFKIQEFKSVRSNIVDLSVQISFYNEDASEASIRVPFIWKIVPYTRKIVPFIRKIDPFIRKIVQFIRKVVPFTRLPV